MTTTLIVGGYGSVGRTIAKELMATTNRPAEVAVAGRDGAKADAFANQLGQEATGVGFDVGDAASYPDALEDVDQVIVCLDQEDTAFVEACLERGIDYVDVTASDEFFRRVEGLDDLARDNDATAVLSVGLAPGVTNLLAKRAVDRLSTVSAIRIGVLLGLGEAFGPAASRWTLERIGRAFTVSTADGSGSVHGFTDPASIEFPGYGERNAYRFDFADQHVLNRTLDGGPVSTRLCFDSRLATAAVHGLARSGLYRPLVNAVGIDRLTDGTSAFPVGGDGFAVTVDVDGTIDSEPVRRTNAVDGQEQSQVTGLVAATVARAITESTVSEGVSHIHEVIEPDAILDVIGERGYRITTSERSIVE